MASTEMIKAKATTADGSPIYGETEASIAAELADVIGPDTVVTGMPPGAH